LYKKFHAVEETVTMGKIASSTRDRQLEWTTPREASRTDPSLPVELDDRGGPECFKDRRTSTSQGH